MKTENVLYFQSLMRNVQNTENMLDHQKWKDPIHANEYIESLKNNTFEHSY